MQISDAFPLDPPSEWFTTVPDWFEPNMKLTIITEGPEAGRVAATIAQRGTFLLGAGDPWTSEDSPTNYRDAMQGDTVCADGTVIRTANLCAQVNHVPIDPMWTYGRAVDAMANTGAAMARICYRDIPGYGTVALGAAWPGISDIDVRKMQASALSGDWRWREEYSAYDMAGAILVNSPGMPLPTRPVFTPIAMAASLSFEHPPIVGSWGPQEELMNVVCPICSTPLGLVPRGDGSYVAQGCTACAARGARTAAPGDMAAPDQTDAGAPADEAGLEERIAAVEERLDAVEAWLTENAMSEMEGMAAALPENESVPATTD